MLDADVVRVGAAKVELHPRTPRTIEGRVGMVGAVVVAHAAQVGVVEYACVETRTGVAGVVGEYGVGHIVAENKLIVHAVASIVPAERGKVLTPFSHPQPAHRIAIRPVGLQYGKHSAPMTINDADIGIAHAIIK